MANAKIQTVVNNNSVKDFLNAVADEEKRKDSFRLLRIMQEVTGLKAKMWGPAIVGFGSFHYVYDSGREGDMPLVAFSPRKQAITLYLSSQFENRDQLLTNFGKHKSSKACIYFKRLANIDEKVLRKMIILSVKHTQKTNLQQ